MNCSDFNLTLSQEEGLRSGWPESHAGWDQTMGNLMGNPAGSETGATEFPLVGATYGGRGFPGDAIEGIQHKNHVFMRKTEVGQAGWGLCLGQSGAESCQVWDRNPGSDFDLESRGARGYPGRMLHTAWAGGAACRSQGWKSPRSFEILGNNKR